MVVDTKVFGIDAGELYVASSGITHRKRCTYFPRSRRRWDDAERRDLLGHAWCPRCAPELAARVDRPGADKRPAHRADCSGPPLLLVSAVGLGAGAWWVYLGVCPECRSQSYALVPGVRS